MWLTHVGLLAVAISYAVSLASSSSCRHALCEIPEPHLLLGTAHVDTLSTKRRWQPRDIRDSKTAIQAPQPRPPPSARARSSQRGSAAAATEIEEQRQQMHAARSSTLFSRLKVQRNAAEIVN